MKVKTMKGYAELSRYMDAEIARAENGDAIMMGEVARTGLPASRFSFGPTYMVFARTKDRAPVVIIEVLHRSFEAHTLPVGAVLLPLEA